jgi:ABC-type multidrug transport system ATPase subunit
LLTLFALPCFAYFVVALFSNFIYISANVDLETDERVQLAIKKEFSTSTVLMVAHRILTVIDCDQILVMSEGEIMECGHPYELLRKHFGEAAPDTVYNLSDAELALKALDIPKHSLASMVAETGFAMSRQLIRLAAAHWHSTHSSTGEGDKDKAV